MAKNSKQTSEAVATLAAETLRDRTPSRIAKQLAGAALSQSSTSRQTGAQMEALEGKVMQSEKYSDDTKTLPASVVAQANNARCQSTPQRRNARPSGGVMGRRTGFEGFLRAAARAAAASERERQRAERMELTQARQLERHQRQPPLQSAASIASSRSTHHGATKPSLTRQ